MLPFDWPNYNWGGGVRHFCLCIFMPWSASVDAIIVRVPANGRKRNHGYYFLSCFFFASFFVCHGIERKCNFQFIYFGCVSKEKMTEPSKLFPSADCLRKTMASFRVRTAQGLRDSRSPRRDTGARHCRDTSSELPQENGGGRRETDRVQGVTLIVIDNIFSATHVDHRFYQQATGPSKSGRATR